MNKDRDQLAKRILEETLDEVGEAQREKEVDPSDLQCLRKQLGWWHRLWLERTPRERRAQGPQGAAPALPPLWLLSAGRPSGALVHLACEPMARWPAGFFRLALWTRTAVVVLSELAEVRETLVLRLMGPPRVRARALEALRQLPADDPEHQALSGLLSALRYAIERDSLIPQAERESFMTAARAEFQKFQQDLIEQGIERGMEQGLEKGTQTSRQVLRAGLEKIYEHRFGPMPLEARDALVQVSDLDRLHALLSSFLDGTAGEIAAQLLPGA